MTRSVSVEDLERWEALLRSELERVLAVFLPEEEAKQAVGDVGTEGFEKVLNSLKEIRSHTEQSKKDSSWRRAEFERGYHDGLHAKGSQPTSQPYIDGYETGKFTAAYRNQG